MLIAVVTESETPLYQQLRDRVVEGIASGDLAAGDRLPATRHLASDLGINFHTVGKGYDALRTEGLLRISRKSGAVIARDPSSGAPAPAAVQAWTARARTLLAEAVAQGIAPAEVLERCGELLADLAPDLPRSDVSQESPS